MPTTATPQTVHFIKPSKAAVPANERWSRQTIEDLFNLPFNDLMFKAQQIHREHFNPNEVQLSTLLSIKTGGCPEDCGYCPQSVHYDTGVAELIRTVKDLDMEACCTLGMLSASQADTLKDAGLDYYNHNLDTAPELYGDIISTRDYQERLDTLAHVRSAGMHVCSGGIVGMGESRAQRAGLVHQLANLQPHPESVPINNLVQVEGTPLHGTESLDLLEFVRTIAVARITMPTARVRLSAGRQQMGDAIQALCFMAGANSIFYGDKLLTTGNPDWQRDQALLGKLGMTTS